MRPIKRHFGKWNLSKYKILMTLFVIGEPATCKQISYWSGIPVGSVWRDIWRYDQNEHVIRVGDRKPFRYKVGVKGKRFLQTMRTLHLIDTARFDRELKEHQELMKKRDMEEFWAKLKAEKRKHQEAGDT